MHGLRRISAVRSQPLQIGKGVLQVWSKNSYVLKKNKKCYQDLDATSLEMLLSRVISLTTLTLCSMQVPFGHGVIRSELQVQIKLHSEDSKESLSAMTNMDKRQAQLSIRYLCLILTLFR